jgi:hypothetical protein
MAFDLRSLRYLLFKGFFPLGPYVFWSKLVEIGRNHSKLVEKTWADSVHSINSPTINHQLPGA